VATEIAASTHQHRVGMEELVTTMQAIRQDSNLKSG
jgi:hypothetical protein